MWLQLDVDTFDDSAIAGLPALHQHVWTRVLCTAKAHGSAGVLRRGLATPAGLAAIWACEGLDADTVANALRGLETSGQLRRSAEGALVVVNWPRYQRDPTSAQRSRKWREARQIRNSVATQRERNANATRTPGQGQGQGQDPDLAYLPPSGSGSPTPQVSLVELALDGSRPTGKDKSPEHEAAKRILTRLADLTGVAYRPTPSTLKPILARLCDRRERFTEADLLAIVEHRNEFWPVGHEMRIHLRPSTLFRPSHCAEYLAHARANGSQRQRDERPANAMIMATRADVPPDLLAACERKVRWGSEP